MARIEFTVLSYYPSAVSGEKINVGILFHNLDSGQRLMHTMENWERLEKFDSELDVAFFKKYLAGIKHECEGDLFSDTDEFSLSEYVSYFSNELRFDFVKLAEADDPEAFMDDIEKVYMRLDFRKEERISKRHEASVVKSVLRANNVRYSTEPICGFYDERVSFDYLIGNYGFKIFEFEDKDLNRMISTAKSWSFNALSLEGTYKVVFIYDTTLEDSKDFQIIMNILKSHADVISSEDALNYTLEIGRGKGATNQERLEIAS